MRSDDILTIRSAQVQDRSAVFEFLDHIWDDDYLELVWDDWLLDQEQPFLVAEWAGVPVGLARLGYLGQGEGWFQGLRVAEHMRGQGIGRQLLERCIALARERGDRSLRLMTGGGNIAMQRIAVAAGLRLELESAWLSTLPLDEVAGLVSLPPDELPRLLDDLERSELVNRYDRLYATSWRYLVLNETRLAGHLERGEVLCLPRSDAWAIVVPNDEAWLGYAVGTDDELPPLLRAIRSHAWQPGWTMRVLVPATSLLRTLLVGVGYTDEHHREHCYSILFAQTSSRPVIS